MNRLILLASIAVLQSCATSEIRSGWEDIERCEALAFVQANAASSSKAEAALLLEAKKLGGNKVFKNPDNENEPFILQHRVDGEPISTVALEGQAYFCDK